MQTGALIDGDAHFTGVNELLPPGVLAPGELAAARNARFRLGRDEPRRGFYKVPWSNLVTAGASSQPIPYGRVYGRGYWQDDESNLWCIIAADGKVFKFREGNGSSEVPLPSGVSIDAPVTFTQTISGLFMFRGLGNPTLLLKTLGPGFMTAVKEDNTISGGDSENPDDGDFQTPEADRGEWIDSRLYVPTETDTEKDLVNISDFLNGTRFAAVRSQARINQGSNDRLIRVLKFGKAHAAVCFKTGSIYALYDTLSDLSSMSQDEITREFGLLSPRACINVGKDEADQPDEVWFLGSTGSIYRITPDSGTGLLGVASLPVSIELQKTMARINRRIAASTATMELFDDRLYVAVPLDEGQSLSPELVRGTPAYSGGTYTWPVIPGEEYFWTPGANDTGLVNGSTTFTRPARFTASGLTVTLQGSGTVTCSLKRVYLDVNNAVLVYDFVKGKWCGHDEALGLTVQEFIKMPVDGEEQLFFIGADGFVNHAEALFDDETAYESLGNNLHANGTYDAFGYTWSSGLIPGRRYAYVSGVYESQTVNGDLILAGGAHGGTFVAQDEKITSYGPTGQPIGFEYRLIDWELEYAPVDHDRTTRAYRHGDLARKRHTWVRLNLRTFNPSLTVTAIVDGVAEEHAVIADETRDNTKWLRPAGKADWVTTNENDDHGDAYREDYHVDLSDAVSNGADILEGKRYYVDSEDCYTAASVVYNSVTYNRGDTFVGVAGETAWSTNSGSPVVYPPGSYILPGENGVVLDLHQDLQQDYRVGQRGREIQFRLRTGQGRAELVSLEAEATAVDQRRLLVKA